MLPSQKCDMSKTIFWFRRDLRLDDNAGLFHALKNHGNVLPLFIFDNEILDKLQDRSDARVSFLHSTLAGLKSQLNEMGSDLMVKHGRPTDVWAALMNEMQIEAVYTNHDFEPYAISRDQEISSLLSAKNIAFRTFKDHVIFERSEVVKDDGLPYTVFTPYSKKWLMRFNSEHAELTDTAGNMVKVSKAVLPYPNKDYFHHFAKISVDHYNFPTLAELGFSKSAIEIPPRTVKAAIIKQYGADRNFPEKEGTSKLGIHLRFGTVSIRAIAMKASQLSEVFLSELIWRDFYSQILFHFPYVVDGPFKKAYANINWRNDTAAFQRWCEGKTGYPIVDAGMRELNATGFMHNRVRMITASFLCKHLLVDWRWGEAYFAEKLLDFDLASNSGGWQWAAGCGTDAAPYFRIFNPEEQTKKFDAHKNYIKKWVPEYGTAKYPAPVVDHKMARDRCLKVYKEGLER